jgi:hypothetical protein
VESRVQALLVSANDTLLGEVRPCDIHILANSLKLRKACILHGIPNECLRFPRRPLVHQTHLFNQCLLLSHFPKSWKEAKVVMSLKPGKDHTFLQNLHSVSLLFTISKLFEKITLKIVQSYIE